MPVIEGLTYKADLEWDKEGRPVLYITAHGRANSARDVLEIIRTVVREEEASTHQHICVVYNVLDVSHLPFLGRFINSGEWPTTVRTAHIILATTNQAIRLVASLAGVAVGKRLRTVDICETQAEVDTAVARWLALPERTREYRIDNI
ncbi:MAG: hypothetical protein ACYDBJ_27785 [Aggregatilineales bacterium]